MGKHYESERGVILQETQEQRAFRIMQEALREIVYLADAPLLVSQHDMIPLANARFFQIISLAAAGLGDMGIADTIAQKHGLSITGEPMPVILE